jgi:thymidylate kinase
VLITFSGLDGAGKSTLIAWLRGELERRARPVAVFHMNDHVGVYAYLRAIRDRLAPPPTPPRPCPQARPAAAAATRAAPLARRLVAVRNAVIWNKQLRRLLYPIDLALFWVYRLVVEKLRGRVLIMDRYFYDTLVDITGARRSLQTRLLSWLTPAPSLSIYLDCNPENAFGRKNEYSVDYLRRRRLSYLKLISDLPSVLVLCTDQDLDATRLSLASAVRERMVAG